MVDGFQSLALQSRLGIPIIYGIDAVHGNNNVYGATIFPHNVGLGATRLINKDSSYGWDPNYLNQKTKKKNVPINSLIIVCHINKKNWLRYCVIRMNYTKIKLLLDHILLFLIIFLVRFWKVLNEVSRDEERIKKE